MAVGVRELKNRLSYYLRRVRAGETVRVTDRGAVVAELRAPRRKRAPSGEEVLEELAAQGLISRGSGKVGDFEPIKLRGDGSLASAAIIEDRG